MNIILEIIVMLVVQAGVLPFAKWIVVAWTWLYSAPATDFDRQYLRDQVKYYLDEQISDDRAAGFSEASIAVRILIRKACELKEDISWSTSCLPEALAHSLERGSNAIGHVGTPTQIILPLATIGYMNCAFFMFEENKTWIDFLILNVGATVMSVLVWNQQHLWARRVVNLFGGLAVAMMFGIMVWTVFAHRLYDVPGFSEWMFAMLPFVLAITVSEGRLRSRFFGGRWLPVFLSWGVIAAFSLIMATVLDSLDVLPAVTALAVMAAVAFLMVIAMQLAAFAIAIVIWRVGLMAGMRGMRLLAAGFRRSR